MRRLGERAVNASTWEVADIFIHDDLLHVSLLQRFKVVTANGTNARKFAFSLINGGAPTIEWMQIFTLVSQLENWRKCRLPYFPD